MKKILFDCERMKYPNTGPYNFCLQLGKALLESKSEQEQLSFLITKNTPPEFGTDAHYFKIGLANKLYLPWSNSRFMRNTGQFNVWHSTYQSTMYYPLNKKTKVVLTIHDLNFLHEFPGQVKNEERLALIQQRVDRADHIVCISEFCLNEVRQHLRIQKPATVIYNGASASEPVNAAEPALKPRKKFLLSLGTVLPKKNFHVLPALLQGNDFELIIAGIDSSDYKNKILENARQVNVTERVKFTGPISEGEKQWYYEHCEAFLFPSLAEGFGLPAVEAMSHGKPVFLSTNTALPEVGGEHAYYFNDFSPENMQHTLAEGLSHFYRTHPQEEIKKWASRFSWSNAARSYIEIYRSLIG